MNLVILYREDFLSHTATFQLSANDPRFKHITTVLKLSVHANFKAGLLNQSLGKACISELTTAYLIGSYTPLERAPSPAPIHLLLGSSRPLVMGRLVKDIASLNIHSLSIFSSENSEKSYLTSSLWQNNRYMKLIHEGLSQGGCINEPMIHFHDSLAQALAHLNDQDEQRFILHPYEGNRWPHSLVEHHNKVIHIAIGSERGFTPHELLIASQHHFELITLTKSILRTESAVLGTLILALHSLGR